MPFDSGLRYGVVQILKFISLLEEKRAMVEKAEHCGMRLSAVTRKYGVNPNKLFRWRLLLREGALCAVGTEDSGVPLSEVKELQAKVRELERTAGEKTMEVGILKDAIRIAREKTFLLRPPLPSKDDSK